MIHDTTQKQDTTTCFWGDIDLFLFLVSHPLVKDTKFASIALLPVRVEVYNGLVEKKRKKKGGNCQVARQNVTLDPKRKRNKEMERERESVALTVTRR